MNNRRLHAATWIYKVEEWVYAMPAATCQGELFDMTHRAAPLEPGAISISLPSIPRWCPSPPTICLDLFAPAPALAHDSDLTKTPELTTWQCDEKRPCSACIRHDVKCSLLDNPPPAILQREQREQREREASTTTTSSASPEGSKSSFSATMDHVRSNLPPFGWSGYRGRVATDMMSLTVPLPETLTA